jgi:hypothetical protein
MGIFVASSHLLFADIIAFVSMPKLLNIELLPFHVATQYSPTYRVS